MGTKKIFARSIKFEVDLTTLHHKAMLNLRTDDCVTKMFYDLLAMKGKGINRAKKPAKLLQSP